MDSSRHSKLYPICDLETSGNDPDRFGVISFAMVIADYEFRPIDSFSRLVKPPGLSRFTWQEGAQLAHKIPFEKVWYEGIPNDQFCYELLCWLAKYKPIKGYLPFVCHASKQGKRRFDFNKKDTGTWEIWPRFDWNFLERCFRKAYFNDNTEMVFKLWQVFHPDDSFISTVNMARDAGYKGNSLDKWAERLRFPLVHHDPMSDTLCALEIFKYLMERRTDISSEFNNGI